MAMTTPCIRAADTAEDAVRRYADTVYRLAYAQTRSRADAEDIFQEVFLRYLQSGAVFESEEHRKAWLLRVTVNLVKNHFLRGFWARNSALEDAAGTEFSADPRQQALYDALGRLPKQYRAVLHLFYFEGYSTAEIGAILKQKESTVRAQLTRARRKLADILGTEEL